MVKYKKDRIFNKNRIKKRVKFGNMNDKDDKLFEITRSAGSIADDTTLRGHAPLIARLDRILKLLKCLSRSDPDRKTECILEMLRDELILLCNHSYTKKKESLRPHIRKIITDIDELINQ